LGYPDYWSYRGHYFGWAVRDAHVIIISDRIDGLRIAGVPGRKLCSFIRLFFRTDFVLVRALSHYCDLLSQSDYFFSGLLG
jgi:hypothetical protein